MRLTQAQQHLTAFKVEREAFLADVDGRIIEHFNPYTAEYFIRLNGEPPDPRISLMVSDFLHQLRATLDGLAWELVVLNGGTGTNRTQFPIYENETFFRQEPRRHTAGMSSEHHAMIEESQPFKKRRHDGDQVPLYVPLNLLRLLNDHDKHRYLHVAAVAATSNEDVGATVQILPQRMVMFMKGIQGKDGEVAWANTTTQIPTPFAAVDWQFYTVNRYLRGECDDPTELMYIRFPPKTSKPKVNVKPPLAPDIAVGHRESEWVNLFDLIQMIKFVEFEVERFAPEFD